MSQKVLLDVTFLCEDHAALLRACIEQGLVPATPPMKVDIHGVKLAKVPSDWVAVEFGERTFGADWEDGSTVYANSRDHVITSTRGYMLDVPELLTKLAAVPFDVASFGKIRWWDNRKGPAYDAPEGTIGTAKLGFAVAFRGQGHDRAMSRRWLDRGPWRVLRGPQDTTLIQFHDENADVPTSLAQARPGHAQMADRAQAPLPLRGSYRSGMEPLRGIYVEPDRRFVVSVAGRRVERRELRNAVATRYYQLLGPDQPVDNVVYSFMEKAELEAALLDLWLYGLEGRYRDASGPHRMDDSYQPPPYEKPEWVQKLGRDDSAAV